MEKVRIFFKVQTNYQLFMVNLVFALTGTSSLVCADYILKILYVNPDTFGIESYWTIRIILILPIYQVLLIFVGAIFKSIFDNDISDKEFIIFLSIINIFF